MVHSPEVNFFYSSSFIPSLRLICPLRFPPSRHERACTSDGRRHWPVFPLYRLDIGKVPKHFHDLLRLSFTFSALTKASISFIALTASLLFSTASTVLPTTKGSSGMMSREGIVGGEVAVRDRGEGMGEKGKIIWCRKSIIRSCKPL